MKIKAVILDFGGTMADGELVWASYHESLQSILGSKGYDIKMSDLKRALTAALAELNRIRVHGKEMTFEDVYAMFLRKLGIPEELHILEELHDNFRKHYRTEYFHCLEDVLKMLSSKYKVALLSNTMSDQPKRLLRRDGLDKYFDLMICSSELGIRKPNPKIFKHVLDQLKVKPENTVHVGDSVEADMYGARDSGITGIWIKAPNQPVWNGYALKTICELPKLLKQIENN